LIYAYRGCSPCFFFLLGFPPAGKSNLLVSGKGWHPFGGKAIRQVLYFSPIALSTPFNRLKTGFFAFKRIWASGYSAPYDCGT